MIFGGGLNQLGLIMAARELGLVSVVVDPTHSPPGRDMADHFYQVGKEDYDGTRNIAVRHGVAGIVTGQMERPLKLMALLARELGFIFHSPEVVAAATNKYLMKKAFQAHGVPCAAGKLINEFRILDEEEMSAYTYPVVIKPLNWFSSQGVYRVESYPEYRDRIESTLSFSTDGSYLIEEFIEGPEYSAESITYRGQTTTIQYTEKEITPYPCTVEVGHVQPAELTSEQKDRVNELVARAVASLGIDNSVAHTEFKWTSSGLVIIEVGPRSGGDFIGSLLTQASTGINMDKAAIQVALGEEPTLVHTCDCGSAIMYLTLEPGSRILNIEQDWEKISSLPGILEVHLTVKPGHIVEQVTDSSKRSGWVISKSSDGQLAKKYALDALTALKQHILMIKEG